MFPVEKVQKIDVGRLFAVSIFVFFMIPNILVVYRDITSLSPMKMTKPFGLIHHLLVVCFYALIILFYFLRSPAISTSRSLFTNTIAVLATFSPFALPLLGRAELSRPEIVLLADFTILLGMAVSIYSLALLGRSFSIIPQARKLVQCGPYRLIRHPLYLGELLGLFGVVIAGPTISRITLFFLIVACQVYRALQEEKLLTKVFHEYRDYCLKTSRFIPGVF